MSHHLGCEADRFLVNLIVAEESPSHDLAIAQRHGF